MKILLQKKGFTMIELLIVIAVLGILAVAVLSAINPIEQINRSRDTGSRSDSEQLISAVDRFYASKGYYPWQNTPNDGLNNAVDNLLIVNTNDNTNAVGNVLNKLEVSTQELKSSFIQRITATDYNHLWIYNEGDPGSSTYVCFIPRSNSFLDEAWKRCNETTGGNGAADNIPADLDSIVTDICRQPNNSYSCLP